MWRRGKKQPSPAAPVLCKLNRDECHQAAQRWGTHLPTQETQETWVRFLDGEDPLGKGMATHSSILTWRIPWTEEPRGLQWVRQGWVTEHTHSKRQGTERAVSLQEEQLHSRYLPPPTHCSPSPAHPTFPERWQLGLYHTRHHLGWRPEALLWENRQAQRRNYSSNSASALRWARSPSHFLMVRLTFTDYAHREFPISPLITVEDSQ